MFLVVLFKILKPENRLEKFKNISISNNQHQTNKNKEANGIC